ncbi:MAG: glycosyltransferase family 9 protein [Gammaproteobacteria bacterium]|nr:glycosyltransferase family 9 protein [Gammaproteobacteria bacterium]
MTQHLGLRLPNWLGDVIMTLPTLEALTQAGYTFELFGKPWIKDLFTAYDYPTHALPKPMLKARRMYQTSKIKTCILFPHGLSSAVHLVGTGIKAIGYRANGRSPLLYRSLKRTTGLHEIMHFWELAQFAVEHPLAEPQNPKLQIASVYQQEVDALLKKQGIEPPFIVLCPGAVGLSPDKKSKIWPFWHDLVTHLAQQGQQVLACPAPAEVDEFKRRFPKHLLLMPNLNIPQYAALLQRATQVIANDSGPMHLAAAVGAPVLGLFGQTDPQRTKPWGGRYRGELHHWPSLEAVIVAMAAGQQ